MLTDAFLLTFKFAPFAGDQVERVSVTSDDVLARIACRAAKDDNFGLGD